MPETTTKTHIGRVRTVGIPVEDQDQAIAFYVNKLGFSKGLDAPFGQGQRWVEVTPPGGGASIALLRAESGLPIGVDTQIRLTSEDVAADYRALADLGVDIDPEITPYPVPMFRFHDPDGNRLTIVEERS